MNVSLVLVTLGLEGPFISMTSMSSLRFLLSLCLEGRFLARRRLLLLFPFRLLLLCLCLLFSMLSRVILRTKASVMAVFSTLKIGIQWMRR